MEFDLGSSSLHTVLSLVAGAGAFIMLFAFFIGDIRKKKNFVAFILSAALCLGCGIAALVTELSNRHEEDTKFSQQLLEEYGATSDRSLYDIRRNFEKYNEATAKFTRDGSETTVFVKRVSEKDGKLVMVFSVIDDKSLYPKAAN